MTSAFAFGTPFFEQIEFFRQKLNLPTARWDDIMRSAHDRAFIVAGAAKADLLNDLNGAVAKAIGQGTGLEAFRADFRTIVEKHGWHGWTGEGSAAGEAWRTKVIYQTNMATSYAAGRYRQLTEPGYLKLRPYWRYVHNDSVMSPRPQHAAWGQARLTLPHDHPFWKTHFPPNGWGCQCRVVATEAPAPGDATAPPEGWDKILDKTGEPVGIDKGFGYAPGANAATPLREMVEQKLFRLDAPTGAAMWESLKPALALEQRLAMTEMVDAAATTMRPAGNAALAHVVAPATVADLAARNLPLVSADIWLRDAELIHALRDTKAGRSAALSLQDWRDLPALMERAVVYLDTHDSALVYVFDAQEGTGKVVVRVNYISKVQIGGKRDKLASNFVRTGGVIEPFNITEGGQYVPLAK